MSNPPKKKVFAGISTGVELEEYARSILEQVLAINEGDPSARLGQERAYIGVEPMLLALAMEFALKAWFVWDHDRHDPLRTHNLAKLYDALPPTSQERLNIAFEERVAPFHRRARGMEYGIRDILNFHANAFVQWRYPHEVGERGIGFDFTTFIATLEVVLDEFGKRYETKKIEPWPAP